MSALMRQTVIRLAVEIETDREDILAQLIAVIMALFVGGRYVWQAANRAVYEVGGFCLSVFILVSDIAGMLLFIWKVLVIHYKAYRFGLLGI